MIHTRNRGVIYGGDEIVEGAMHLKPSIGAIGQVSYVEPFLEFDPTRRFFINPLQGFAMNLDASSGGVPDPVHDGEDTTLWTASQPSGNKVDFNSTERPRTGSNSIKVNAPAVNDIWQWDKGSTISAGAYVALTGYINIDSDWSTGDSVDVYAYDTAGDTIVGVRVCLEDYMQEELFDEYQKFAIPFSDMGMDSLSFDAFRMELVEKQGPAPKFFLDDIQIEETGGSLEYVVAAPADKNFHIHSLQFSFVGPMTSANLSYDKLLNLPSLASGLILKQVKNGIVHFSVTLRQLSHFVGAGARVIDLHNDGSNTILAIEVPLSKPLILEPNGELNYMSVTVSDNLEDLLECHTVAKGALEV